MREQRLHMPRSIPAPDLPDYYMDDQTDCRACLDRPRHRLRRFEHRLWVCSTCLIAWYTERDHLGEIAVWHWRKWSK